MSDEAPGAVETQGSKPSAGMGGPSTGLPRLEFSFDLRPLTESSFDSGACTGVSHPQRGGGANASTCDGWRGGGGGGTGCSHGGGDRRRYCSEGGGGWGTDGRQCSCGGSGGGGSGRCGGGDRRSNCEDG
eukprot:scaffold7954_cov97-Isochrysis_galbana.AAC.2